jgi:flagellar protein FliS
MWRNTYLETRVLTASPIDLVNILYEHAIVCVQDARSHLAANDISARANAICKAIKVISELRVSLDHAAGGEIAARLESLYEYMQRRLTESNVKRQDQPLAEIEALLKQLAGAFSEIGNGSLAEVPQAEAPAFTGDVNNWNPTFAPQGEFESSRSYWSA